MLMLRIVTLSVYLSSNLAVPVAGQDSISIPELGGFRIGDAWAAMGRSIPCRAPINPEHETLLWPDLAADRRDCEPSDSVILYFARDTLFAIGVQFSAAEAGPRQHWAEVARALEPLFGLPDSVTITPPPEPKDPSQTDEPRYMWIHGFWTGSATRPWVARVTIWGHDSYIHSIAGALPGFSSGDLMLHACVVEGLPCDPWKKGLEARSRRP
jgi:hypothetical protein